MHKCPGFSLGRRFLHAVLGGSNCVPVACGVGLSEPPHVAISSQVGSQSKNGAHRERPVSHQPCPGQLKSGGQATAVRLGRRAADHAARRSAGARRADGVPSAMLPPIGGHAAHRRGGGDSMLQNSEFQDGYGPGSGHEPIWALEEHVWGWGAM
eukprot:360799-Chlamydomonas_euryale.AAC.3